jgi:hypothetical protein
MRMFLLALVPHIPNAAPGKAAPVGVEDEWDPVGVEDEWDPSGELES